MTTFEYVVDPSLLANLTDFLKLSQEKVDRHMLQFPNIPTKEVLSYTVGPRYIRIVRSTVDDGRIASNSAWAFIVTTSGDILKPASFKAPAKHVGESVSS